MAEEVKKAVKVKKDTLVTVYGTAKSTHLETGKAYRVHQELAKKLITKDDARKDKAEAEGVKSKSAKTDEGTK